MMWLVMSIVCSSLIFVILKSYDQYRVNTFPAIVINYGVAFMIGSYFFVGQISWEEAVDKPWALPMFLLGLVFVGIFYLMALTAQRLGVSVSSVAAKMAMAIPVLIFILIDPEETLTWMKALGILLALAGVWFTSTKGRSPVIQKKQWVLPLVVFLGSGLIDFTIGYFSNSRYISGHADSYLLTSLPFLAAFLSGTLILVYQAAKGKLILGKREMYGGLVLGVVNFGSIFFLVKAIDAHFFQKSALFPVNNLGIILLATLISLLVYREVLTLRNKLGIAFALVSIAIFALVAS